MGRRLAWETFGLPLNSKRLTQMACDKVGCPLCSIHKLGTRHELKQACLRETQPKRGPVVDRGSAGPRWSDRPAPRHRGRLQALWT